MKPTEIIAADTKRRGFNFEKELALVHQLIKKNNGLLLQSNNTLILLVPIGVGKAEMHLYTADAPLKLMKSAIELDKKIKKSDIKFIYYEETNPQITEMLRRLDLKIEKSDLPNYDWMINVRR